MKVTKFVQCGRAILILEGPYKDKLAIIINPVDEKSVLIDGPTTGVPRHIIHLNRVKLTKFVIPILHTSSSKAVKDKLEKSGILEKWESSLQAIKIKAAQRRATLNDFERFCLSELKTQRSRLIKNAVCSMTGKKPKFNNKKTYTINH